jgi:hypothetical protein
MSALAAQPTEKGALEEPRVEPDRVFAQRCSRVTATLDA